MDAPGCVRIINVVLQRLFLIEAALIGDVIAQGVALNDVAIVDEDGVAGFGYTLDGRLNTSKCL